MLIWINGTFGVGKTQTAHELKRKLPGSIVADPELLGFGIQRMYPPALRVDFQDTPWWAPSAASILADIATRHPGDVIVPMTLARQGLHRQIFDALHAVETHTRHFTLLASRATVAARLRTRFERSDGWAMNAYDRADAALRDPYFATHLPTDGLSLPRVVCAIGSALGRDWAYTPAELLALPMRRTAIKLKHIR